jgi:hypothetical protein
MTKVECGCLLWWSDVTGAAAEVGRCSRADIDDHNDNKMNKTKQNKANQKLIQPHENADNEDTLK